MLRSLQLALTLYCTSEKNIMQRIFFFFSFLLKKNVLSCGHFYEVVYQPKILNFTDIVVATSFFEENFF